MNKLSDHILNRTSSKIPVWFMRQAGRYLPEFREIRKKNSNFIELCLNTNLVKEITIQPLKRFDLDAAIIFSDILMVPFGLGQQVRFEKGEGPILGNLDLDKILETKNNEFSKKLKPVYDSIKDVKKEIKNKSCIGFVGAPWTLILYMINKRSPKKDLDLQNILKEKELINQLLKKVETFTCLHIENQIKAGADIIQIFDSWAGLLPQDYLNDLCFEPNRKIASYVKSLRIPVICFPRGIGTNYLKFNELVKPSCINIDYDIQPEWAKNNLKGPTIQGGLDPKILLENNDIIKTEVEKYIKIFKNQSYIFNLGHGVLPETKPETIEYIIKLVKEKSK